MKKRELSALITAVLTTSLVLSNVQVVKAEEYNNNIANEVTQEARSLSEAKEASDTVYLSNMEYDSSKSYTGYGPITKDEDIDGNKIKLIVDGETVEFEKGMAAHATSSLVYNVSSYKDTYNRFISYVGIDKSQYGQGNGVKFSVYTSVDGINWTLAKDFGLLYPSSECAYLDIDISNANYIKLYADDNGWDGNDHAVYGDAKLVTQSYGGSAISSHILKEVSEYDEILRSYSVEDNMEMNEITILRRDFVSKIGYDSIRRLASKSPEYREAIEYLLNDITALRYFVTGGPINIEGSYTATIKYFSEIYEKYSHELKDSSDDNFNLRLAMSISLSYAKEDLSKFWEGSSVERDAALRYETYKELISSGKMDEGGNTTGEGKWSSEQFKALPVTLMRWAVDNRINEDEITWLADYALKEKAKGKDYLDAYNYIEYTDEYNYDSDYLFDSANYESFNDKYDLVSYFTDYGRRDIHRLWMVFEEGAVCGGLAKTYTNLADTFGRPSSVVGQPGHAATITYAWNNSTNRYEWVLQNDITGWAESGNEWNDRMLGWGNQSWSKWDSASYTVLATDIVKDYDNYVKATELNILAKSYTDNVSKMKAYFAAQDYQMLNLDSMEGLINVYKVEETVQSLDYFELGKVIIDTYTYYPQAMVELLDLIRDYVTEPNQIVELDLLQNNALIKASKATAAESTNVLMTKQMADTYLGTVSTELAEFSFDGENANKIVLNSKYDGSSVRIKYSLDGGESWTDTDEHVITLTEEQVSSINSTNDIKVGLVGGSDIFTIDILESKTISNSTVYNNDLENLLVGDTKNLEYSLDNGMTWNDYISGFENGTRITGNTVVKVRYKANGHYLAGDAVDYTFTEDKNTANRNYVSLNNVKLVDFASEQDDFYTAATNFIDGSNNTEYHTRYNHREENKFYTVSFDKERFISSIEYTPSGQNGRIKSAEIYTSLDGENWVKSGSVTNLANDTTIKTINLSKPTSSKYFKLVATETYGNSIDEANMYLSGRMLSFFEDTTMAVGEGTSNKVNNSNNNKKPKS